MMYMLYNQVPDSMFDNLTSEQAREIDPIEYEDCEKYNIGK